MRPASKPPPIRDKKLNQQTLAVARRVFQRTASADSGEKREPVGDIDIAVVDSLKVLDPRRPIREADMA
jgi:hypothetical protein